MLEPLIMSPRIKPARLCVPVLLWAFCLSSGLPAAPASDGVPTSGAQTPTNIGALWRSALLPGWGQLYKGISWRGALLFGGFALHAAALNNNIRNYRAARREHNEQVQLLFAFHLLYPDALRSGSSYGRAALVYGTSERKADAKGSVGTASGALAVIYIYNLVDAFFFGRSNTRSKASGQQWDIGFQGGPGVTLQAGHAAVRFSLRY